MEQEDIVMAFNDELGDLIIQRTPYKKIDPLANWKTLVEWDEKTLIWQFRELPRRVAKSIRIPVCITYHNDQSGRDEMYIDWLLIGYEGGGGGM